MKFTSHLTFLLVILKFELCFLTYWKHSTICTMTVSQYGISGNLLQLRRSKQSLKQRIVLNDQASSWVNVLAGVPQGSILGPFFCWFTSLIYQMIYAQMLNYLLTIHLFFQLYMTKISQPKTLMTTYRKYVSGLINGKWALSLIFLSKH